MKLIGLSGKKQAGKNTVAKIISDCTTEWVFEVAFGIFVKQEVAIACGTTVSDIDKNKPLFRPILQWWGTEYRRGLDSSYWLYKMDKLLARIFLEGKATVVVVTDVRFKNEYDYVAKLGGFNVRVSRPVDIIDNHPSEIDLDSEDKWDSIILNTTTIEDLVPQVKELMKKCNIQIKL